MKCPKCSANATIQLSDTEVVAIRNRITVEGRSPTVIVKCESGHELLVTLYNLRNGEGLGVRDIVVPVQTDTGKDDSDSKEVDWLAKAFGGED